MIKTLLLILILLLASFMAFIPHIGYAYPVHLDEWIHLAQSKAVVEAGSINYPDPFGGKEATGLLSSQEVNYHLLLASLNEVSGIDWISNKKCMSTPKARQSPHCCPFSL